MKNKLKILIDQSDDIKESIKKVIESNKAKWFVEHIQTHIDNNDFGKKGSEITKGKVGCTICGKDVDQIAQELLEKINQDFKEGLELLKSKKSENINVNKNKI